MEKLDLYKVLEVSKDAPQDEIRRSYRRLARKYHPDANPGDKRAEERFKEVQHAYEVLSTPEKRREYDEGPRTFFGSQGAGHPGGANFEDFSDLLGGFGNLGDIFGRSASAAQRTRAKGESITVNVRLSFEDALRGVTTRVGVPVEEACGECRGTGAAPGTAPLTCPECGGRGVQSRDQGFFALSTPCSRCGGEGRIIEKPCPVCGGNGRAGRRGGPAGDLYVVTRVEEHPVFRRRGDDFVVEVPVSFVEAVLGAQIEVPRPGGGTVRVKLPAGTQDGKQFKVRGAGAPRTKKNGAENGNLIVRVGVVVPKKLKRREREILEALAEERDEDVRQDLFKKVRS